MQEAVLLLLLLCMNAFAGKRLSQANTQEGRAADQSNGW
jgi:hypothetical protein